MTITLFNNIPKEVFDHKIYPRMTKEAVLSSRLVSKAAQKMIDAIVTSPHENITLAGKETTILFDGICLAFFRHRTKMAVLNHNPELLDHLREARSDMMASDKKTDTIANFIDYAVDLPEEKQGRLTLSLVPFDFDTFRIPADAIYHGRRYTGLAGALKAAAQMNNAGLVRAVLAHLSAELLNYWQLLEAVNAAIPGKNLNLLRALLAHTNANGISKRLCVIAPEEINALRQLKSMLEQEDGEYTLEDYYNIFDICSVKTQRHVFLLLCLNLGSPTEDIVFDGIDHFFDNPWSILKIIDQLI